MGPRARGAGLACAMLFTACGGPAAPILPGKLDLPVAAGDRLKLCADDGLDDTTPDADCVLAPETDPMKGYAAALTELGWIKAETLPTGERWTRDGAGCGALSVSGVNERFAARIYTLLRFEIVCSEG